MPHDPKLAHANPLSIVLYVNRGQYRAETIFIVGRDTVSLPTIEILSVRVTRPRQKRRSLPKISPRVFPSYTGTGKGEENYFDFKTPPFARYEQKWLKKISFSPTGVFSNVVMLFNYLTEGLTINRHLFSPIGSEVELLRFITTRVVDTVTCS